MKIHVAVFFGCRSVEHEVSIISAVQAMMSMDKEKYDIIPVYVTKSGEMVTGDDLFAVENYRDMDTLLARCTPVVLRRTPNGVVLQLLKKGGLFKGAPKELPVDVAFPIVHGTNCEDGTMQGYFEFLNLPYVGCDIVSSAVGMDKAVFKDVLNRFGLPVLPCITMASADYLANPTEREDMLIEKIGFPLIIKPVNLGSSVGITKVTKKEDLSDAMELAASFSDTILAEHAITHLREINCSVLGDGEDVKASVCEEPFMQDAILSYEDKYMSDRKGGKTGGSKGMASLSRRIPADLPSEKSDEIRELSCRIFKAIGCSGVVRIDYLLDTDTGKVYANEINTIPGSLSFYLWEATGKPYKDLLDDLINQAFRRYQKRAGLHFTIDTNILSGLSLGGAKGAKGSKLS